MLETNVPREIMSYQEKILFGLSFRQLGFSAIAGVISIGSYFLFVNILHLPVSIASYLIVAVCAPFMALGFIRVHGLTFEKYLALRVKHYFRRQPRLYRIHLQLSVATEPQPYIKKSNHLRRRRKYAALAEKNSIEDTATPTADK